MKSASKKLHLGFHRQFFLQLRVQENQTIVPTHHTERSFEITRKTLCQRPATQSEMLEIKYWNFPYEASLLEEKRAFILSTQVMCSLGTTDLAPLRMNIVLITVLIIIKVSNCHNSCTGDISVELKTCSFHVFNFQKNYVYRAGGRADLGMKHKTRFIY